MNGDLIEALEQLQKEKDIPMSALLQTVEIAMTSAYRKRYGGLGDVYIKIDPEQKKVRLFARSQQPSAETDLDGVDLDEADLDEADLDEADLDLETIEASGVYQEQEIDAHDFGRIAAQTAKQVVIQRIREAEREITYDRFVQRIGEVVTAEVQRRDARSVFLLIGDAEAVLPSNEQIPGEPYRFNDRIRVYILNVRRTTKNPQIIVSRTHPVLIRRLFELEVPEVYEGIVEIVAVAREPGARSKVAVHSNDSQVDPVGACVGHRGGRVQAIVDELRGEKIDIVRHDEETTEYLNNALSPARVSRVILAEDQQTATVIAPDDQLSLAIGRRGQNVRLAAQLTGWKIDIRSHTQWAEQQQAVSAQAGTGETMRVYELARELNVESRDLVEILQDEGVDITSHASNINGQQAQMLRNLLAGGVGTLEELEAGEIVIDIDES